MKRTSANALAALLSISLWPSAARADDWSLLCTYPAQSLQLVLSYEAGDPSFAVSVFKPGKTGLGDKKKYQANAIRGNDEHILFSKTDEQDQMLVRVSIGNLTSVAEIGSGVSWDYKKLSGTCEVLEQ